MLLHEVICTCHQIWLYKAMLTGAKLSCQVRRRLLQGGARSLDFKPRLSVSLKTLESPASGVASSYRRAEARWAGWLRQRYRQGLRAEPKVHIQSRRKRACAKSPAFLTCLCLLILAPYLLKCCCMQCVCGTLA